ncbi:ribosomal protein L11 methyltransferase [Campylobacterota bacterium]|nr:ribosomal protein L11 methyltransferase [Campylobacterota bacterium]
MFEIAFVQSDQGFVFAFQSRDDEIDSAIRTLAPEANLVWAQKENESWVENYQKSFEPTQIADFYIHASWHEKRSDLIDITIDPELVFGTGRHETTASCLEAIAALDLVGKSAIDIGCGSGILAIAAAKKGANVTLCDTDPSAAAAARKNCEINGVIVRDLWAGSVDKVTTNYDLVIANIVTDVLTALKEELKAAVKPDGILIVSGVLECYEDRLRSAFAGLELLGAIAKNGWRTFIYKNTTERER